MADSTLSKLIRHHDGELRQKRGALVAVANEVAERIAEIRGDRFYSEDEKARQIARARNEAARRVQPLSSAAREALEKAQRFYVGELDKIEISDVARDRVRRLLDRGDAPNLILKKARQLRDRETIAALRDELRWTIKNDDDSDGGLEQSAFLSDVERALAGAAGDDGQAFEQLGELLANPAIREAERLAIAASDDNPTVARLAYAYAIGSKPASESSGGDGGV